ncbi:ABC transporter ATP-binding protein [[Brevibacterium] frigoritolerans]|uniref:ABC transporter ATP-binding protein n=1 Tax=Peribacillus frigoritolerans TaxID=450367 RepID=A0A941J7U9_9BACI|nr:ABC transporter ATP-binding protein [Peribacillus frigoritolerans]
MLKIEDINVYYGNIQALKGISLSINEGEIVTLIGANGAGKSTLLKSISGLLKPKQGKIIYEGFHRREGSAIHRENGHFHVPEGRRVFANMTVEENLQLVLIYVRIRQASSRTWKVYELFPRLLERLKQQSGTLSGGEQQMLAMGRALMAKPRLLLLDEPSMGLAPLLVKQIFHIIEEINKTGTTILLVEQNANLALSIADRAYVVETGRIVLSGKSEELTASEEIKNAYLGGH